MPRGGRAWPRLLLLFVLGYLYGRVVGGIKGTSEVTDLWVGNIAAAYVVAPALAGAWLRSRTGSTWVGAAAGAMTAGAMVCGFYRLLETWLTDPLEIELPADASRWDVALHQYPVWFSQFVLGRPGGAPWLTAGLVVGVVCGWLGARWVAGSTWAGVLVAAAPLLEPVAYLLPSIPGIPVNLDYALNTRNLTIWALEIAVGLVLLATVTDRIGGLRQNPRARPGRQS